MAVDPINNRSTDAADPCLKLLLLLKYFYAVPGCLRYDLGTTYVETGPIKNAGLVGGKPEILPK